MKPIKGYEGLYSITEDGRVYSHTRSIILGDSTYNGYLRVTLWKNNTQKTYRVHRLVAQAYLPNHEQYAEVNHKDKDHRNNQISNLEWCTSKYNQSHKNAFKASDEIRIQNLLDRKFSVKEIVQKLGINPSAVLAIKYK